MTGRPTISKIPCRGLMSRVLQRIGAAGKPMDSSLRPIGSLGAWLRSPGRGFCGFVARSAALNTFRLSCRTRNFCSSCQTKRAVLFAEKLTTEILVSVPHRHWTFSIPRVLPGLFERDRKLMGLLSQNADADLQSFQTLFDRKDVRPGCVVALQSFGATGLQPACPRHRFPWSFSHPKQSSCPCLRWTPPPSWNFSGACCCNVFMKPSGSRKLSWTNRPQGSEP